MKFLLHRISRLGNAGLQPKGKHDFFKYLKKGLGFTVMKKELKRITVHHDDLGDSILEKGNMDVETTIDSVHYSKKFDTEIFFTGDSDFLAHVNYQRNGAKKCLFFL